MSNTAKDPAVTSHANAPARTITANGTSYAYRELVPTGGIPVIFFVHLAANLDNWDPRILDPIAATRHVIAFDNKRVGASTGQVQDTIEEMAEGAFEFIKALVFQTIDVFSFSLGGMVAQALVTAHPKLVRKLVLAGTGPKGGKDMDKGVGATYYDMFRAAQTRSDPRNFSSSIEMPKVNAPPGNSSKGWKNGLKVVMHPSKWTTFQMQLKAIKAWGRGTPSDLGAQIQPTLIANGDNDRMVPSVVSENLHRRIMGSELIIYPNSGHGGIFQFHEKFSLVATAFLTD